MRNADRWAIPLGRRSHDELHRDMHKAGGEEAWLTLHGIDGRGLAKALWSCRGDDIETYRRTMFRHLQSLGIHYVF